MAKLLAPLGSNQATGTIGKELTFANYKGLHVAKSMPTHPDAQTLAQLYQRRLYYDAKEYWHSLSDAQKLVFTQRAKGHNWSGYNQCLKDYLLNPTDLAIWLKMDRAIGGTLPDSSGKGNTATIFGATPVEAHINYGRSFDGGDDYLNLAHDPSIAQLNVFTMEGWWYQVENKKQMLFSINGTPSANDPGFAIWATNTNRIQVEYSNGVANNTFISPGAVLDPNHWNLITVTYRHDGDVLLYRNGLIRVESLGVNIDPSTTLDYYLGSNGGFWFHGLMDDFRVYNRTLSPAQILNHFERSV